MCATACSSVGWKLPFTTSMQRFAVSAVTRTVRAPRGIRSVVSNARPAGEAEDLVGSRVQAFTDAEAEAIDAWVSQGGSLLLVADHYPFGGYVQALSGRKASTEELNEIRELLNRLEGDIR